MDQRAKDLVNKFERSLDDVARQFIEFHDLKFSEEKQNLSSPMLRWLDFRYRYVEPRPRNIVFSDEIRIEQLPIAARRGLRKLMYMIRSGGDINPYQGRGLKLRNDTSGGDDSARTDLLWASWNLLHFHLSDQPIPEGQYFSRPADYLAFCLVGEDLAAFVCIRRHPDRKGFSSPDFLRVMKRNWPLYMEQFKANGLTPGEDDFTQDEIHTLREKGVNHMPSMDGHVYMQPGMGITGAKTPMRVLMAEIHLQRLLWAVAEIVLNDELQFQVVLKDAGIEDADFSFQILPEGLCIYEAKSKTVFRLPKEKPSNGGFEWSTLHEMIAPEWAIRDFFRGEQHQEVSSA